MLEHQNNKTYYAKNFIITVPAECRKFFKIFLKKLHAKRYKLTFQEQYTQCTFIQSFSVIPMSPTPIQLILYL